MKLTGLYVAAKFDTSTTDKLEYAFRDIPNVISRDEFHSTVIYSKTFEPVTLPRSFISIERIIDYQVWDNHDKSSKILVGLLDRGISKLIPLHNKIMKEHPGLKFDYSEYIPHITVSYDSPDDVLEKFKLQNVSIIVNKIYSEELSSE